MRSIGSGDFLSRGLLVGCVCAMGIGVSTEAAKSQWYKSAIKPSWAPSIAIANIIWVVMMMIYAWCWYQAIVTSSLADRGFVDMMFGGTLSLLLIRSLLLYKIEDVRNATWLTGLITVLVAFQTHFCWKRQGLRDIGVSLSIFTAWMGFNTVVLRNTHDVRGEIKLGRTINKFPLGSKRMPPPESSAEDQD